MTTLDEPVWERCVGCGREYRYPHLCRTHGLCGLCHPAIREEATMSDVWDELHAEGRLVLPPEFEEDHDEQAPRD